MTDSLVHSAADIAGYRARGEWGHTTLSELVAANARRRPSEPALFGDRGAITWAEYDTLGSELARVLAALGTSAGAPLAVALPDGPTVHVAYLACERAGHPIVGVAARSGRREIAHVLSRTRAAALITHDEFARAPIERLLEDLRGDGVDGLTSVVLGDVADDGLAGLRVDGAAQPAVAATAGNAGTAAAIDADSLYLLNSTSGTTGLPKCVMHNQNRWLCFSRLAIDAGRLADGETILSAVPSPYGFGLWSAHFVPALLGSPTVLMERFDVQRMLAAIAERRVGVLACVTTQLLMALADGLDRHDVSSLRVVFTGGEPVPADAAARFEDASGAKVLQFYGSNENGAISVTSVDDDREHRLGTAGRPIACMNVRLYDGERDVTAGGGPGQVASRGPTAALGYYDDPAANRELLTADGWMLSGDLATIGDDGYLRLAGRVSDLIIRGGKNISAAAVEAEAATHPAIALAAAVAMPDPVFGERVCLYAETRPGDTLDLEALCEHMLARGVSREWLPERLIVLERLPRSAGEKVAKSELRADIRRRLAAV